MSGFSLLVYIHSELVGLMYRALTPNPVMLNSATLDFKSLHLRSSSIRNRNNYKRKSDHKNGIYRNWKTTDTAATVETR